MEGSRFCSHCGIELAIKYHHNKRFCGPNCRLRWHVKRSNLKRYGKTNERYRTARDFGLSAKESAMCRSDAGYARLLERIESERNQTAEKPAPEADSSPPVATPLAGGEGLPSG